MVIAKYWNKGNEERRGWNILKFYHPQCWVESGLNYLRMNPYQPRGAKRGPKPKLPPAESRERHLLIRRWHKIGQMRKELDMNYPDRVLRELVLDERAAEIEARLEKLGGVPSGWRS